MLSDVAAVTRSDSTTKRTSAEQNRAWLRFQTSLQEIEAQRDPFLDTSNDKQKVTIFSAFAQALRQVEFSQAQFVTLVVSTVRSSVDYVGSSFRNNFR